MVSTVGLGPRGVTNCEKLSLEMNPPFRRLRAAARRGALQKRNQACGRNQHGNGSGPLGQIATSPVF
jgi:hypothetical protein